MKRTAPLLVLLLVAACDKKPTADTSDAAPAASSAPLASASATEAKSNAPTIYAGKYTAEPATLYIPTEKDYAHTKQAKDDPSKLVGDGTISLTIDPTGRVSGAIDSGPASPAVIDGAVEGENVSANVRRKEPSDEGLYGTLTAKTSGKKVEGVMKLSDGRAALLREAKFSADAK